MNYCLTFIVKFFSAFPGQKPSMFVRTMLWYLVFLLLLPIDGSTYWRTNSCFPVMQQINGLAKSEAKSDSNTWPCYCHLSRICPNFIQTCLLFCFFHLWEQWQKNGIFMIWEKSTVTEKWHFYNVGEIELSPLIICQAMVVNIRLEESDVLYL